MQRAKENVLKFYDRNTKYLHDKVKFRRKRTQIKSLQYDVGVWLTDKDSIAHEIRNHYSKMIRSSNPPNDDDFLKDLSPCISSSENDMLIRLPDA